MLGHLGVVRLRGEIKDAGVLRNWQPTKETRGLTTENSDHSLLWVQAKLRGASIES